MGNLSFYSTLSQTARPEDYQGIFRTSQTGDGDLRSLSGEAGQIVQWTRYRLGEPILTVQLDNKQIFACFQEACIQYSRMVNTNQTQMWFLNILGRKATGNFTGNSVSWNMNFLKEITSYFSQQTKPIVGGKTSTKKAYIRVNRGQGSYNVLSQGYDGQTNQRLSRVIGRSAVHSDKMKITEVYYYPGTTVNKYWDVYSISNDFFPNHALMENFRYRLRPVWQTILNRQMLQEHETVRHSNYNWNIVGDRLKISPQPDQSGKIWFQYIVYDQVMTTNNDLYTDKRNHQITDIWDRPYFNIPYDTMNSQRKRWVRQYCLALCRQTLGLVRRKFSTVQIPNGVTTLDGGRLVGEALRKQQSLRDELRVTLEKLQLQNSTAAQRKIALNTNTILQNIPRGIYIG